MKMCICFAFMSTLEIIGIQSFVVKYQNDKMLQIFSDVLQNDFEKVT